MAVLAALKVRKANEGFLEFSEALKTTFTVFAWPFYYRQFSLMYNEFIDVPFKQG